MASTGRSKFIKYFANRTTETIVRTSANVAIKLYDAANNVIAVLANNQTITVVANSEYSSRLHVYVGNTIGYVSQAFVAKPIQTSGPTENLAIRTSELVAGGRIDIIANTECYVYDDRNQLRTTIVDKLRANKRINQEAVDDLNLLLRNPDKFMAWSAAIEPYEINELGKYLGEIVPIFAIPTLNGDPLKAVGFPTKSNIPLFDSILVGQQAHFVSSKYGDGAAASLYSLFDNNRFEQCWVGQLSSDYSSKQGKNADRMFYFGAKHLFDVDIDAAHDTLMAIGANTPFDYSKYQIVTEDPKYAAAFPKSIAGWINRKVAHHINTCNTCLEQLNNALRSFDITQLYLDRTAWNNGRIRFDYQRFMDATIRVHGNKSTLADHRSSRGTLHFTLAKKKKA